jgi:hypothetical protein
MRENKLFANFLAKILPACVTVLELSPENALAADREVTLG